MERVAWINEVSVGADAFYDYAHPNSHPDQSPEYQLVNALAQTTAFKRLADIRFLGALDYCLVSQPNGNQGHSRFTRAQHSIGVATLSIAYLRLRPHNPKQSLACVAAAMLHDIGHPPFSHTIEPLFQHHFGFDHHDASLSIINGSVPLGQQVVNILQEFDISPDHVVDILSGDDSDFDNFFSGPINFDTIEGILRARGYLKMQSLGLTPLRVVEAATDREKKRSKETVDEFWRAKHDMYGLIIRSRAGVLCDLLFQEVVKKSIHLLDSSDFLSTESNIFKKVPLLRDVLDKRASLNFVQCILPRIVKYQRRQFYVDHETEFSTELDKQRYRQRKIPATLTLDEMLSA
jgi:uncharacterized protein